MDPQQWTVPELVDEALALYAEWREEMAAVEEAYRRWISAPRDERHQRFAAYQAGLDQEEAAAAAYLLASAELRASVRDAA
jgi:hypothetical protein